jgi:hypothetical protein
MGPIRGPADYDAACQVPNIKNEAKEIAREVGQTLNTAGVKTFNPGMRMLTVRFEANG